MQVSIGCESWIPAVEVGVVGEGAVGKAEVDQNKGVENNLGGRGGGGEGVVEVIKEEVSVSVGVMEQTGTKRDQNMEPCTHHHHTTLHTPHDRSTALTVYSSSSLLPTMTIEVYYP